jgi:hypothetical protein
MKIALERSTTPIYDRIVLELAKGFQSWGHECVLIDPRQTSNREDLLRLSSQCEWVVITHPHGYLSLKWPSSYLFEDIDSKVVFLHHDAPCNSKDLKEIEEKLNGYVRAKEKSIHFTIEKPDESDLSALGLNCHSISHINSLGSVASEDAVIYSREVAFIGHVMPLINMPIIFGKENDHNYYQSYMARLSNLNHHIKEDYGKLNLSRVDEGSLSASAMSSKIEYVQYTSIYSFFQRGVLLKSIQDHGVHVFGGDPSWIQGVPQTRFLEQKNISNHKPTFGIKEISEIFSGSKININISSMQFDTAVVNRVLDCAAAGGFILTDRKDQLSELTCVAKEISYASIDELNHKVDYFLRPENEQKRRAIGRQLKEDLEASCSIGKVLGFMLEKMACFKADCAGEDGDSRCLAIGE